MSTNLKTLYNFEEQIEDTLQTVIQSAFGDEVFVTVGDPTSGRELPRLNIFISNIEALDEGLLEISGLGDEYLRHTCTLETQVITDNTQEEQTRAVHNSIVGKSRALLLRNIINLDATNLPNFSIEEIRMADSDRRVDGDVTATATMYAMRFSIRPSAWPDPTNQVG